jgi:aldehyde:ferredoxin oxidoreductase
MDEPYGWAGSVLHVDLSSGSINKVPTRQYEPERYLGGMGLNFRIFWEMGCPKVSAFDPENPLIISSGPLTGLPGPFSRAEVCSISPQAYPNELFTYSGFGGKWPAELKYAGYDGIVVVGRSEMPVLISIHDEDVRILDAEHLWGLSTHETQRVIMKGDRGASVLCMGPAGENLSRNAIIANETGSTAGQGGFGAVMGSKNLKAIAVRGTGSLGIARPDEFLQFIFERKAKGEWLQGASQIWARAPLIGENTAQEMVAKYRKKFAGCFGCPYQCQAFYDMPGVGKGQAMCASWAWAGHHDDARLTWHAQIISQEMGINQFDLIGIWNLLGAIVAEGLLTEEQWGQLRLPPVPKIWGGTATDEEFNLALAHCITNPGHPLSQGGARGFARMLGELGDGRRLRELVELAYPAFGQTAHYFGWLALALHVAMDTRDSGDSTDAVLSLADANVACFREDGDPVEVSRAIGDHFGVPHGITTYAHPQGSEVEAVYEGIERQTVFTHREHCLKNSLTVCNFAFLPDQYFHPPEMDYRIFAAKALSAATGLDMEPEELWAGAGDRIWNLKRAIMVKREGRTRRDDTLSDAVFDMVWREPHPATGEELDTQFDRGQFEALKDRYYALCGWDRRNGWPTRDRLASLDMADVADTLAQEGLLGEG